jgi:uncharacterized Rossmann fold enzyme
MNASISLKEWWPWYDKIINIFGYDRSKDQHAADILSYLLSQKAVDPQKLGVLLSGQPVLVFGAGPSLEENLREIAREDLLKKCVIVSADGATTALLKVTKVVPDLVVTDLDGDIDDLLHANKLGSIMVIHGHGDNIDRLKRYVPKFEGVFGTTQVEPRPNVYNFGGFTDGDRAVFLATAMGAKLVALAGMDLGQVMGEYSKKWVRSVEVKRLKLKICKELLEWLASRVNIPLYNVTRHGENIKGFSNITSSELAKIVDKTSFGINLRSNFS